MKRLPKLASIDDCYGCMLCHDVCPVNAITMHEDDNGFWMPKVATNKCIRCLACERGCNKIQTIKPEKIADIPFKGFNKDSEYRKRSASGGAFAAIAYHMLKKYNAVIIGATLQDNKVFHIEIESIDEIFKLQGSKYIQSNTEDIYKKVKTFLSAGRTVLFSGTPCQVQALNIFLGKTYEKLLTIDLICHGVVSNILFRRHNQINHIQKVIAFRDKRKGWGKDTFFKYNNNGVEEVNTNWANNYFYHAFQLETSCRPNCYKCLFSQMKRTSDITLGDYWADRKSKNYDSNGISSILPNTEKGKTIISECNNLVTEEVDWFSTVKPNPRLFTSRPEFKEFSCSKYIGKLYKFLPSIIADCIIATRYSKKQIFFRPWFKYINKIKQKYETRYKSELSQYFGITENNEKI